MGAIPDCLETVLANLPRWLLFDVSLASPLCATALIGALIFTYIETPTLAANLYWTAQEGLG